MMQHYNFYLLNVIEILHCRLHGEDNVAIKRYVISFWNGVDLRYKLLQGPSVKISIAGIIISRVSREIFSLTEIFSCNLMKYFRICRAVTPPRTWRGTGWGGTPSTRPPPWRTWGNISSSRDASRSTTSPWPSPSWTCAGNGSDTSYK